MLHFHVSTDSFLIFFAHFQHKLPAGPLGISYKIEGRIRRMHHSTIKTCKVFGFDDSAELLDVAWFERVLQDTSFDSETGA